MDEEEKPEPEEPVKALVKIVEPPEKEEEE